jgi:two-component system, cell cycle sensor histidine kinase and response regulator CckA
MLAPTPQTAFSGHVPARGILVVDDEPTVLAVIGQMLKDHFTGPIFFAATAVKAAEVWREHSQIDVLVTDMTLGEASGDRLALEFVRHNPSGRVVFITGWEIDQTEVERTVGKPVSVLRKPFSAEDLQSAIAR